MSDLLADDPDRFVVTLDRAGRGPAGHPTRDDIQRAVARLLRRTDKTSGSDVVHANAPVYWDDETGIWGAAAHEGVERPRREWQTFCSGQGSRPETGSPG